MASKQNRKWIPGIDPEEPVTSAAGRTLEARLAQVSHYAPLAATRSAESTEHVHQLRVATRRAAAALRVFADSLPRRRRRWIQRRLKKMRRAAGDARDYDVQLKRINADKTRNVPTRRLLRKYLQSCRRRAQASVIDAQEDFKRRRFEAKAAKLLKKVRWRGRDDEPSFAEAARDTLASLADRFFLAAAGDLHQVSQLHWLRIQGKRLRYAMEIFAAAFPPSFRRDLYAEIEKLQERLGRLNDHATAAERYRTWLDSGDHELNEELLEELIQAEERKLDRAVKRFHRWWSADRRERLRQQFDDVLQAPGCGRASQPPEL